MPSAPLADTIAFVLILVGSALAFFAFWAWRLRKGIRVRLWFVALFAWFYELLFLLVLEEVLRLPWGRLALGAGLLDLVLFAAFVVPGFQYTVRTTSFDRTPKGRWLYRGGLALPVVWLSLFLLRYGVELALLGQVYLFTPYSTTAKAVPTFAAALIAVDALFAASTGLVMGDSVGIWWAYHAERARTTPPRPTPDATAAPVPSVPPASGEDSH